MQRERHFFSPFKLLMIPLALTILFAGCAGLRPKGAPRENIPMESHAEPIPPPPLEIEAYESISASMAAGDPETAVRKFEKAYTDKPNSLETRLLYSSLLITTGQAEKAEASLNEVLSLDPENTDALYNLALVRGIQQNREAQRELLDRVLALAPEHSQAHATLGEMLIEDRKLDHARREFELSLQNDPDNFVARTGYGHVLMRQKEYKKAEEQLTEALRIQPDYPFAYVDRSKARAGSGDINGALEDLSSSIELDPDHYWNYIDRGRLYLQVGDRVAALADFNRAVELQPDYFLAYVYRAGIAEESGETDLAVQDYRRVISLRKDYFPAYEPLALLEYRTGDYSRAAEHFARHFERYPDDHGHALMAGISWLFAGETEHGLDYLKKHLDAMPRETYLYDAARLFIEKKYESYLLTKISQESKVTLKIRALFYLATFYKLQNETSLANKFFLEVADANIYGLYETKLAEAELAETLKE